MHKAILAAGLVTAMALGLGGLGGCNDVGSCPAKETIMPGGTCSGDSLECAYDLPSPSPACDGTDTTIPTSCFCNKGTWSCPSPLSCEAGDDAAGGSEDGGDASSDGAGGG